MNKVTELAKSKELSSLAKAVDRQAAAEQKLKWVVICLDDYKNCINNTVESGDVFEELLRVAVTDEDPLYYSNFRTIEKSRRMWQCYTKKFNLEDNNEKGS